MVTDLTRKEVITFIREHEKDDPAQLMLKAHVYPDLPMDLIASQIISRQKAAGKLPEWHMHSEVLFPPKENLEQTSDEQVARYRATYVSAESFADLSAGTGIDLFYMSEYCTDRIAVEPSQYLTEFLRYNMQVLNRPVAIHETTAEEFLRDWQGTADVIFIDPSRRDSNNKKVFQLTESEPTVPDLLPVIMKHTDHLIIKASPMLHIDAAIKSLSNVALVEVISLQNEVKEVCMHVRNGYSGPVILKATDIISNQSPRSFEFTHDQERQAVVETGSVDSYLYDPMSSIRKAGGFRIIAERYALKKLHPNTHLYTSSEFKDDFPGRVFRVLDLFPATRKEVRRHVPDGMVNLVVRNFPMSTNQIKDKYRLKDGGERILFLTQAQKEGRIAILCKPV